MLRFSTLSLVAALVIGAAILAGVWRSAGARLPSGTRTPPVAARALPVAPETDGAQASVRSVYPGLVPGTAPPRRSTDERASPPLTKPGSGLRPPDPGQTASLPGAAPSADPRQALEVAPTSRAETPSGAGAVPPEAGVVDLNTGSVEDLNRLGAGMIGRRIVGGRPYASPDDLVTRRVLTRRDFDQIRTQVVVQGSASPPQ